MDRELLSRMICELIVDHDVVGLPGVGSFVAELVPASFSDRGFTIHPPYRRLLFKPNCIEDQLLVNFYSENNKIPQDIAREYIFQFLAGLCDVLKDKKNINLPGLGRLRATKENNFFFVPDEDLDIFPETFALKAVSLKSHPLIEEKLEIPFSFKPKNVPVELETLVDKVSEGPESEEIEANKNLIIEEFAAVEEQGENETVPETTAEVETAETTAEVEGTDTSEPEAEATETAETTETAEELVEADVIIEEVDENQIAEENEVTQTKESEATETIGSDVSQTEESEAIPTEEIQTEETKATEIEATPTEETEIEGIQTKGSEEIYSSEDISNDVSEEQKPKPKPNKTFRWWIIPLVLVILAAIALAAFLVLGHVAPDLVDSILYTPEELWIINY